MISTLKKTSFCLAACLALSVCTASQASLVAYYPFEGNVNDLSGNGYNGTVGGPNPATAFAAGKYGQAFSFNGGTNIATTTTDNLGLVGGSFTVSMWVNMVDTSNQSFFGTTTGGTNLGLHLVQRGDKALLGFYANDTGGNTAIPAGQWTNLAFVYDAGTGTQRIFFNGNLDATSGGHAAFAGTGQTAMIGATCCEGVPTGLIDNIKVFNTALSQAEVQAAAAPEPASLMLLAVGGVGALVLARRRRSA